MCVGEVDAMVTIALEEVTKVFSGGVVAVDRLSLDIASGEFFALLGPTGCGKSTVLRMIAGLDHPTSGHVLMDGQVVDEVPPQDRLVGMVFQHYALHPHMTVAENIAQPLRATHARSDEVAARVMEIAERLGIAEQLPRLPAVLSGGQRQRTAMARAMLRSPRVFLLDEPLSNLDAGVRAELRGEISRLARELATTTVYVTHDQVEAMTMADRVGVLRRGVLQQVGTPHEVYEDPATLFVAAFLGTPRINLLQGALYARPDGDVVVDLGTQVVTAGRDDRLSARLAAHHNERVTVGLRPEALRLASTEDIDVLRGRVRFVEHLGHEAIVHLETDSVPAAPGTVGLDLPESSLSFGEDLPVGGPLHAIRHPLEHLVPRHRRPDQTPTPPTTARTEYGFYPVYEGGEPQPAGDLVVRVPADAAPNVGDMLALAVDVHRILLFDHAAERIYVGPSHAG
jgi:multiple sugar transport system ATP-binding protein